MKPQLQALISDALKAIIAEELLPEIDLPEINIDRTRQKEHGDFSCNIAMLLAKHARCAPRELAQSIVDRLPAVSIVSKVELAGPGFINFFLTDEPLYQTVRDVIAEGSEFGHSDIGDGQKVIVEFVSANPTGPLHVGHGRGAAYGDALARLLRAAGYQVSTEYYVNDAGRQMNILAVSVWLRYLELCGEEIDFPANAYQGDYVWDIAASIHRSKGDGLHRKIDDVFVGVPPDEPLGGDKESHIDGLIKRAKELLADDYELVFDQGLNEITDNIRRDLAEFGVEFDRWFSERSLHSSGEMEKAIQTLESGGYLYEKGGAKWFRSTTFGDEKDRVVVRDNGQSTYFASDIAYHLDKLDRGYDRLIDIWGADHHGYVARVKAALQALNAEKDRFEVLLVQFAILYRGGEKLAMSTRSGEFVTLRELRSEVGNDAARFFYVMRKCEQHMDFDLDLAKSRSNENPVYYVQYAHARICSVLSQLAEKKMELADPAEAKLELLTEQHEKDLMNELSRYHEVIEIAAVYHEPHQIAYYLRELANGFHSYYNASQFLVEDKALRDARLVLIQATRQVLANGLGLLGVSAPESM
ncbi:MAG: arginine--tRNA ligase [Pseudomonadota bacterium]|nr:arginine--tRNA ligase [Pseudomonadota bacterium]